MIDEPRSLARQLVDSFSQSLVIVEPMLCRSIPFERSSMLLDIALDYRLYDGFIGGSQR